MIVVFVVDTSPSMGEAIKSSSSQNGHKNSESLHSNSNNNIDDDDDNHAKEEASCGMTKLDLAKMTVESIAKMMDRRIYDHNARVQHDQQLQQQHSGSVIQSLGLGGYCMPDQFLLLSTGVQRSPLTNNSSVSNSMGDSNIPSSVTCEAGGRLLVGFGEYNEKQNENDFSSSHQYQLQSCNTKHDAFEKELKSLKATIWKKKKSSSSNTASSSSSQQQNFPQDGGGANGLNIALSSGLQLLSRYRLHNTHTDNFGMGRIPTNHNLVPNLNGNNGGNMLGMMGKKQQHQNMSSLPQGTIVQADQALQPACLILLTDGECLRRPKSEGGGPMQLQFNLPLRELYREPFRWDQRTFCIGVGPSSDNLHPSLRAFCDVTGGITAAIRDVSSILQVTDLLSNIMAPTVQTRWPLPNPLHLPHIPHHHQDNTERFDTTGRKFVNGGPICCFQQLEAASNGQIPSIHRAMLLYSPTSAIDYNHTSSSQPGAKIPPPIWVIPESFFPSKKLDSLPPRTAQPILNFSRQYQIIGSNSFDPLHVMKLLHRLDQLVTSNHFMIHGNNSKQTQQHILLQRDVYQCEWIKKPNDHKSQARPHSYPGQEHFPVSVRGAGRPSLSESDENLLNIGILHIPVDTSSPSSLTLLPPDIHILLPLLLKVAEVENRVLKKAIDKLNMDKIGLQKNLSTISKGILLDENWRSEFRAYLFRLPPYYMFSLSLCLRPLLPSRAHSLVSIDSVDSIISQCFSRQCLQKIRNGEQHARENVDRLERKEEEYRNETLDSGNEEVGYGHFDKRSSVTNYLNALRHMPPPWKPGSKKRKRPDLDYLFDERLEESHTSIVDSILSLPHECLLAFYESRRRWIFGGTGLSCSGLAVDGVHNSGSNVHHCKAKRSLMDEPLLCLIGVGASTLEMAPIKNMGEFKSRLLFTKQSIIGYGCNDSTVSAATTAADGSPIWSMSDESLPLSFFDQKTAEFNDSVENRIRAKLTINFGNPYKIKKGDSIIPETFASQRPSLRKHKMSEIDSVQGSPPHDTFAASVEGEGEAMFVRTSPTHKPSFLDSDETEPSKKNNVSKPRPPPPPATGKHNKPPTPATAAVNNPKPPPPITKYNNKPPPPATPSKQQSIRSLKGKPKPPPPSKSPMQPPPPAPKQPQSTSSLNTNLHPGDGNKKQMQQVPTPSKNIQIANSKAFQSQSQKPPPPKDIQSPSEKPRINLPPGWICVWSKSQRRWYFFDQRTNKSVWEWPPPGGAK